MTAQGLALLAGVAAAGWTLLSRPVRRPGGRDRGAGADGADGAAARWVPFLAGVPVAVVVAALLGGWPGWVAGALALAGTARWLGGREPGEVRRAREQARADLPWLVGLLLGPLRAGADPASALRAAAAALPGEAADRVAPVLSRLAWGGDPAAAWESLADDDALAPLGRAAVRATASGAPLTTALERLAEDLAEQNRAHSEELARSVGVRAAVPLGVLLLPAFLVLGVVPLVVTLFARVTG